MKWPRFSVFRSPVSSEWYWNLRARNGEIIAQSEGYKTRQGALKGIRSVRLNAPVATIRQP